jgi:hypothetical protein
MPGMESIDFLPADLELGTVEVLQNLFSIQVLSAV